MSGSRRKRGDEIILCYFLVVAVYIADQLSKLFATRFILQSENIPVINNIFHLTLVHNTGAAFGFLREFPILFIIISIFAIFVISYLLLVKKHLLNIQERVALSFILGGALGNLTDRIRFSYVIDFLDFRVWPVFNVADSFITIGALILVVSLFVRNKQKKTTDSSF